MPGQEPDKRPVRVTILNRSYTLLAAGEEREVQELADSVNELMSAIAARAPKADNLHIAVLACLHLADRLRALEAELEEFRQRVEQKSHGLRLLLEQAMQAED